MGTVTADEGLAAEFPRLGSMFGRYRLDAILGRGGMGVVFRATDMRLERPVALKFLAPELARDAAFRERFVRESRLAAAIEHPGIVPVYEAGASGSVLFIAMRFVPGHDLGSILRLEAPLDVRRTLRLAGQVADALDAAHRRGLVHRDVKPANVLVEPRADDRRDERASLADFGLSRRLGDSASSSPGGPLGTIDYMAPEQAERSGLDGRADQYALAGIVFHCLTGSPPFEGDTEASILYAHVHAEPPRLRARRPDLPPEMEVPMRRGLAKRAEERFPDCRSLIRALTLASARVAIPEPIALPAELAVSSATRMAARGQWPAPGRRRGRRPVLGILAAAASVGLLAVLAPNPQPAAAPGSRADASPSGVLPAMSLGPAPGEAIVFASDVEGNFELYLLAADSTEPRRLTRTSRHERSPAISPDGTTIAYVVGTEPQRDIWLMDSDGGDQRPLTSHAADDIDPAWSSDGRSLAFASRRSDPMFDIFEIRDDGAGLDERKARNLTSRPALEHFPTWLPASRRLAIASNHYGGNRDLFLIDADDATWLHRLTTGMDFDFAPTVAPDGESIAFYRRPPDRGLADIVVMPARGGATRRLTNTRGREDVNPAWSPDGERLVYASGPLGSLELFVVPADGGQARRLTRGWSNAVEPDWGRLADEERVPAGEPGAP
jgi:Tol biopolymer transport system component